MANLLNIAQEQDILKNNSKDKYRVYLKALKDVRDIIDTQYVEGGWLPSERALRDLIGVSRNTCRKVIARLIDENVIKSMPRQGHWILKEFYRCSKVGIVLNNGAESPFVTDISFLSSILDTLQKNRFSAHFIQANSLDNLLLTALSHAVNSLIWITPGNSELEQAKKIQADGSLPLVLLFRKVPEQSKKLLDKLTYVAIDCKSIGKADAEFIIRRGHRQIAYLGEDKDNEIFNGLIEYCQENGIEFNRKYQSSDIRNQDEFLTNLMKKHDITAIISEGRLERCEKLFKFCNTLPKEKRPEILLPNITGLKELHESYPGVKIAAVREYNAGSRRMAKKATDMVIKHLRTGEKMKTSLEPVVILNEKNIYSFNL